jgi:hypothetical protein
MLRASQKIIIAAGVSALVNCLVGHLVDWCLFEVLGLPCPGGRN